MPPQPPTPRVRISGLSAGYSGRTVLHQVTAEIPGAAVTSLTGPNGSGKSTLLGVLAGVIKPTSGEVEHRGGGTAAFVPQRSAVSDTLPLTVRQTVAMGRWADRGPWRRLTARDHATVDAALRRLGIAHLAGRQLGELSGGQRQRTFIAQGVAQDADLLLLDEPCTGLDPEARASIEELLVQLVADGATVVQATHDLESAGAGEHRLRLRDGRLDAAGHRPAAPANAVPASAPAVGDGRVR